MSRVPLPPSERMKLTRLAEIARGGMGSVELARVEDGRLAGQIVALKRLHPNIASDPQFVSMFLDEAWLTAALRHPNVAQVVAWGDDDKGMYLAVELVQGVSLSRLLKEAKQNKEPFAERTVANLCSQICAGLIAAHDLRDQQGNLLGLVHRDLTPANVLVSFDGVVKIIDFGIAKAEQRISHTQTGTLKGKPAYMAPEQARGGKVDLRADIFSFGVMMFELLAGRRPWTAKAAFDVMMEIAMEPPPDLAQLRRGLNPDFVAIINKCLSKTPEERYSSAAEIKALLDGWRAQKGFLVDDQQSLAAFVVRNSTAQIAWYKRALSGELVKDNANSFKALEEKIDADRESKDRPRKAPPPLPGGGRGAPPPPPAAGGRPPDASMPMIPSPSSTRPQATDEQNLALPPSRPGVSPSTRPAMPSSPPGSGDNKQFTGAGTEYMAMSPFATGEIKYTPPPAPPPAYGGSSPVTPMPNSLSAPPGLGSSGVHAPPVLGSSGVHAPPVIAQAPPGPPPGRSSLGLIILLVILALIGAAGFGVWWMSGQEPAQSPPPPGVLLPLSAP